MGSELENLLSQWERPGQRARPRRDTWLLKLGSPSLLHQQDQRATARKSHRPALPASPPRALLWLLPNGFTSCLQPGEQPREALHHGDLAQGPRTAAFSWDKPTFSPSQYAFLHPLHVPRVSATLLSFLFSELARLGAG